MVFDEHRILMLSRVLNVSVLFT